MHICYMLPAFTTAGSVIVLSWCCTYHALAGEAGSAGLAFMVRMLVRLYRGVVAASLDMRI